MIRNFLFLPFFYVYENFTKHFFLSHILLNALLFLLVTSIFYSLFDFRILVVVTSYSLPHFKGTFVKVMCVL